MARLRATITAEYDVPDDPDVRQAAYRTTDLSEMAEVDREAYEDSIDNITAVLDGESYSVTVEPIEAD